MGLIIHRQALNLCLYLASVMLLVAPAYVQASESVKSAHMIVRTNVLNDKPQKKAQEFFRNNDKNQKSSKGNVSQSVLFATNRSLFGETADVLSHRSLNSELVYGVGEISCFNNKLLSYKLVTRKMFRDLINYNERVLSSACFEQISIAKRLKTTQDILFIHGYNTTFSSALETAARLAQSLSNGGTAISYSWESAGVIQEYVNDRLRAKDSSEQLASFLKTDLLPLQKSPLNIIAHSMGSYVLTEALRSDNSICGSGGPSCNIFLVAPDVSLTAFRSLWGKLHKQDPNRIITTYMSYSDVALTFAEKAFASARLGLNRVSLAGVKEFDATAVDYGDKKHSYIFCKPIQQSIRYEIISHYLSAKTMMHLREFSVINPDTRFSQPIYKLDATFGDSNQILVEAGIRLSDLRQFTSC